VNSVGWLWWSKVILFWILWWHKLLWGTTGTVKSKSSKTQCRNISK